MKWLKDVCGFKAHRGKAYWNTPTEEQCRRRSVLRSFHKVTQDVLENTSVAVVVGFAGSIDAHDGVEFDG